MLAANIITPFIAEAFFLDHPKLSMHDEMIFSKTAITVEKEAKVINRKKRLPHTLPPCILTKTFGRVTKIRLGPDVTSTP